MPVFMCRWPNGGVSFLSARNSARNREDAIIALDELDNAELAELRQVRDFMVDFRLADSGALELQGFGESCQEQIWERAYPVLAKAMSEAPKDAAGEPTSAGKKSIRAAMHIEKERLVVKKALKLARTELGRSVQNQFGASAALINRRVNEVANGSAEADSKLRSEAVGQFLAECSLYEPPAGRVIQTPKERPDYSELLAAKRPSPSAHSISQGRELFGSILGRQSRSRALCAQFQYVFRPRLIGEFWRAVAA